MYAIAFVTHTTHTHTHRQHVKSYTVTFERPGGLEDTPLGTSPPLTLPSPTRTTTTTIFDSETLPADFKSKTTGQRGKPLCKLMSLFLYHTNNSNPTHFFIQYQLLRPLQWTLQTSTIVSRRKKRRSQRDTYPPGSPHEMPPG